MKKKGLDKSNVENEIEKIVDEAEKKEGNLDIEAVEQLEQEEVTKEFEDGMAAIYDGDIDIAEEEIKKLIFSGHMFKAHELAKNAFEKNPDNVRLRQVYALVLLKTGAFEESRKLIYPLLCINNNNSNDEITTIDVSAIRETDFFQKTDGNVLADFGHIFKEAWHYSKSCNDLDVAKEFYLSGFQKTKNPKHGMQAAWLFWLTGIDKVSYDLAEEVLKLLPPLGLSKDFFDLITLAQAQLLLGREEDACRLYEEAVKNDVSDNYINIVNERQHLYFLRKAGFKVPEATLQSLTPPTVVVFSGYSIDHPSFKSSLFPQELESIVKSSIKEKLDEIDAKVGYSSASCGADILFIEAMLERNAEVNIVLPFSIADFLETNIRHAGPRWEKRFEMALKKAKSVSFAAEDRYLGHDMLYRFSNNVMHGAAVMRSEFLTTKPHLMAVWHSKVAPMPGGPSDFIDSWNDISTLHLIDLDEITNGELDDIDVANIQKNIPGFMQFDPFIKEVPERTIKSMMFSDLSGYSKLQDEHVPAFLDFLNKLHEVIEKIGVSIEAINTWGDAVFAVADSAIKIAEFGLKYCDIIEDLGQSYSRFPFPIRARISLHSGPVFVANDPFINKMNFYGGHINRAARLEPVTTVGQVYATQQFISILHKEVNLEKNEADLSGFKYYEKFATEYVGVIPLAKGYGQQEVYHLRWNN